MITICAVCLELITQVSPLAESRVSHGLCRLHSLEFIERAGMTTEAEAAELKDLLSKRVEITAIVPASVANALEARRQLDEVNAGRSYQFSETAGMLLTREANRTEWTMLVQTQ